MGLSFRGGRRNKRSKPQRVQKRLHRINDEIRASEVRLLDPKGEMLGVVSLAQAKDVAKEHGVDLVEVSPRAVPPVCQAIDYGKMLYLQQKKDAHQKKAQKTPELKGIRLTFRIGPGDMDRQRKHTVEFLKGGHSVRVQLLMRGREKAHRDLAYEKIKTFISGLEEFGTLDGPPKGAGHQIIAIIKPKGQK